MTTVDNTNPIPQAPAGETQPVIMVPPTQRSLPGLPDWIPPNDTGQPSTSDLNDLTQYRRQTIAAMNSAIPTCYGRDRFFGALFVLHINDTEGNLYAGYAFCKGEIEGYETIYIDNEDRLTAGSAYMGLKNRGFESGDYWAWTTAGDAVEAAGETGTYAGVVSSAGGGPNLISDYYPCPPEGYDMYVTGSMSRKAGDLPDAGASIGVRWYESDGTPVGGRDSGTAPDGETYNALHTVADWQALGTVVTVPALATQYRFDFGESPGTTGKWYCDNAATQVRYSDNRSFLASDAIELVLYRGIEATQRLDSMFVGQMPTFEDDYADLAYVAIRCPKDASQGFPRLEAIVQGKKVYDLRKDDTNAEYDVSLGVSTHRIGDVTTWEYTTNPSICFADFILSFTDWILSEPDLAENATYNDVLVGGVPRRELGLTLLKASTIEKWMQGFRPYCGAYFTWEAGELRMITERADVLAPGAVFVDGTAGTWVSMGDQVELDFSAAQDFSIEFKFKMADTTGATQVLVGKKNGAGGSAGYVVYMNSSDQLVARIDDGTTIVNDADTTTDFFDNEWHHAAMTIDQTGNELILTVDGTPRTPVSIAAVTGTLANAVAFRIGANGAGTELADCLIDEVRVWNDVRTPTEITDNMDVEITDPALDASLVGYWRLNDATGSTAVDSSVSANDGTLAGAAGFATGDLLIIPDGVLRHFTADDINDRGFTLKKKPNRSLPTEVQVEYTDAAGKAWPVARQKAQASGVAVGTTPRRISKIGMPGIHSAAQANRLAIERLNWFLSDLECSLPVFDEGLEVQQGSIVAVTHPIGLTSKLFRVRGITGNSGRWVLDLAEYDPQIYSNAVIADPTYPDTQLGDPLNPPLVIGLTAVEELYITKEGNTGSRVRVTWDASLYPFLSQYRVEGVVGGVIVWQTFVGINEAVSPGVEQLVSDVAVDYDVNVYIRSAFGEGEAAATDVQIQGKLAPPSDVPSPAVVRIGASTVKLSWGKATDIDIWRYEVRQGTGTDTWAAMAGNSIALVDDLNFLVEGLSTDVDYRWGIKAIDSVRNESTNMANVNLTLTTPTPLTSLNGFEIAGEVRLNWAAPADPYVARYRVAYDDSPTPTSERTLDITDSLVFSTKDVPAGTYEFAVYTQDEAGNESATAATRIITVTLDADAFLADEYDFVTPSLTNMVQYNLRVDTRDFYVTNDGAVFISSPSSFAGHTSDPLANYHSDTTLDASEWLSETHDFGLSLTGNWLITDDIEVLNGSITKQLELSNEVTPTTWDVFTGGNAKGEYRHARYRISTFNPPGTDTAFVKVPEVNLKVNVVPLEENGEAVGSPTVGKTINLGQEYTAVKEVNVQPKNKTDALMAIVDNIIVGPNTGIQCDGTNYLLGGDWAGLDHGTADFSLEYWTTHTGSASNDQLMFGKRNGSLAGWTVYHDYGTNEIDFRINDGTNNINCLTTGDALPNDGDRHHVAILVDRTADQVRILVDTVEVGGSPFSIVTLTGSVSNSVNFNVFATNAGTAIHESGGLIDELRIWNDERTDLEISDNYQTELDVTVTQAGLAGYWRMNGVTSAVMGGGTTDDGILASTNDLTDTGAGDLTYVDMGSSSPVQKINSFDVYVFDIFGQQLAEAFQWNWKAV